MYLLTKSEYFLTTFLFTFRFSQNSFFLVKWLLFRKRFKNFLSHLNQIFKKFSFSESVVHLHCLKTKIIFCYFLSVYILFPSFSLTLESFPCFQWRINVYVHNFYGQIFNVFFILNDDFYFLFSHFPEIFTKKHSKRIFYLPHNITKGKSQQYPPHTKHRSSLEISNKHYFYQGLKTSYFFSNIVLDIYPFTYLFQAYHVSLVCCTYFSGFILFHFFSGIVCELVFVFKRFNLIYMILKSFDRSKDSMKIFNIDLHKISKYFFYEKDFQI